MGADQIPAVRVDFGGEGMTEHTPTPWGLAIYRDDPNRPPTVDKIKHMLCESVDRTIQHGGSIPDIYFVCASVDPKDPVFTAITGNGPHSEANAAFIVKACNCHEELVQACKAAHDMVRNCPGNWQTQTADMLGMAIAKAEGKS